MTTLVECGDEKRHSESACYFGRELGDADGKCCPAFPDNGFNESPADASSAVCDVESSSNTAPPAFFRDPHDAV